MQYLLKMIFSVLGFLVRVFLLGYVEKTDKPACRGRMVVEWRHMQLYLAPCSICMRSLYSRS